MPVQTRMQMLLAHREAILNALKEISPLAKRLVAELRQNDRDLGSGKGAHMVKHTVGSDVVAYLLELPEQRAHIDLITKVLSPDEEGPDWAKLRANVTRSISQMHLKNGAVVVDKDGIVSLRKRPKRR